MNIVKVKTIFIEKSTIFKTLPPNELKAAIEGDSVFQLALAFFIELNHGQSTSLAQWLSRQLTAHDVCDNSMDTTFISTLLDHPALARMIEWHVHNQAIQTRPMGVFLDLIQYLMDSPTHTLDLFLEQLKPNHSSDYHHNISEVKIISQHPFLAFQDLHKGLSQDFEVHEHNRLYWANDMIYRLRIHSTLDKDTIRYSTYLDIIANYLIKKDSSLKQYSDPSPLGTHCHSQSINKVITLVQNHIIHHAPPIACSKSDLLRLINQKRFQFGMSYFDSSSLKTIKSCIHKKPTVQSDTDGLFIANKIPATPEPEPLKKSPITSLKKP